MICGMDHVGIAVSDLAKSIRFYHHQLGLPIVEEFEVPAFNLHIVFLKAGNCTVELLDYRGQGKLLRPPENPLGLRHFTLRVENLNGVYEELRGKGLTFTRAPMEVVPGRIMNAFLLDPDGVSIELIQWL